MPDVTSEGTTINPEILLVEEKTLAIVTIHHPEGDVHYRWNEGDGNVGFIRSEAKLNPDRLDLMQVKAKKALFVLLGEYEQDRGEVLSNLPAKKVNSTEGWVYKWKGFLPFDGTTVSGDRFPFSIMVLDKDGIDPNSYFLRLIASLKQAK